MKTLILGMGAFGFAIGTLIGNNNKNNTFYAYELNNEISDSILKTRKHPYFFDNHLLPENINIIESYDDIISDIDLLIIAIPSQFISDTIKAIRNKFKPGISILNLSKGIDIKKNKTISEICKELLYGYNYNYLVLSGGMIASELLEGKILGADLGTTNEINGEKIKKFLENDNFSITLRKEIKNIELYGSFKNIAAILIGYYEGKGYGKSSIGYLFVQFYEELKELVLLYGGNSNIEFGYYSLGGDLIATCFGESRNRYFGQLLGEGMSIKEVLEQMKKENKYSEGLETIKSVYKKVNNKKGYENIKFLYNLVK